MLEVKINANDAGQRLDKYLSKSFPNLKKSMMYKAIRNKKIKVNRKRCTFDQFLNEGDTLLLFLPPDVLETDQKKQPLTLNTRPLEIIYEDDDLLVVNKPAGLLSQKDSPKDQDSLNERILGYLITSGQYDPEKERSFTPAICHRLDRNTSGLVIAAKTARASRDINEAIRDHEIEKDYLAIVEGKPLDGPVQLWLKKEDTKAVVKDHPFDEAKEALMDVKTLQSVRDENESLVELDLKTGRFHQIRACMAYLGHPLAGDLKYGGKVRNGKNHQELQAYRINFSRAGLGYGPEQVVLPEKDRLKLS